MNNKMNKAELEKISRAIQESHDKTRKQALQEGLVVMERIASWWTENNQLLSPLSVQTLTDWTNQAITKFKEENGLL